jgi:uncharacterized cysteine cluster protein YcgN (CxxCxxCC family)
MTEEDFVAKEVRALMFSEIEEGMKENWRTCHYTYHIEKRHPKTWHNHLVGLIQTLRVEGLYVRRNEQNGHHYSVNDEETMLDVYSDNSWSSWFEDFKDRMGYPKKTRY